MGFEQTRLTPYAPWGHGTVDHSMINLGKVLKTSHTDDHKWKTSLKHFLRSYRVTPHCTLGYPPAQLLFNNTQYKTRLPNATVKTQTCFNLRKPKKSTNARKLKQNERQTTKHMRRLPIYKQSAMSTSKTKQTNISVRSDTIHHHKDKRQSNHRDQRNTHDQETYYVFQTLQISIQSATTSEATSFNNGKSNLTIHDQQ